MLKIQTNKADEERQKRMEMEYEWNGERSRSSENYKIIGDWKKVAIKLINLKKISCFYSQKFMSKKNWVTYHHLMTFHYVLQMLSYVLIKVLGIVLNQSLLSINQQILDYCSVRKKMEEEINIK